MGVLLTLGIMGLFGVPLNPANMIAFPLILGVGVDNGVHVLHDYLIRRGEGRSTISYAIGRGVLVKALTTMIGFGTLMISSERGLAGLGLILTLGVGCCMLSALVFLPAVLHLLGGRRMTADVPLLARRNGLAWRRRAAALNPSAPGPGVPPPIRDTRRSCRTSRSGRAGPCPRPAPSS